MATGDTWTTLYAKKLLGFQALGARMRDVLRKGISDTVLGVYGQPFLLSPTVTCDISTADQCPVVGGGAAVQAVDGQGEFIYAEDGDPGLDLPFENTLNEFYNVGLYAAEFPIGVEINPRTGAYKYSATQMGIGLVAAPNSVSVGGGGLWIGVDAVCEADHDHSMRTVRVWLKNGLASPVTAVAIQDCAVQYMILEPTSLNMIHVPNSLGQAVPSTDPADYQVALLGPIVRRYDAPPSSSVLVASVKGGGAGNPPVSVTTFGVQSVVPTFARINELIEWVGVHPKIRVRAQTGEANVPQISMLDVAGVRTWTVDGTGNMVQDFRGGSTSGKVMQLTSTGDTWIQTIAGVLQLVSDVAGKAVRVQPGTGAPLEVVTSWIQGITGALTFGDANTGASLTIPLSSATDTAIDGDLPQTILGAFKAAADHQRLLKYTTGMKTGSLASAIWFLGCTAGTGRVVNVGEGYYSNNGRGVSVPAGTITTTDNATKYIYVDTVAKTFGLAATIGPDLTNTSRVVVAKVVAAAGVITEIVNVVVAGTDRGFPVNVIVSAVTTPGVHFTSLSDAIKAVGEWSAPTAGSQIRDWRIVVVGSVTESSVNLPINIPCDGITIEGCTRASAIHWGGDNPLFELNGHTDFSVSKLLGVCSNTAAVPVGQTRVLLHDNGTGDPPRFALKDLRITGGALSGLFVGRGQDFVIQNVYACNCVDFAVAVSAGGGGGVEGCRFERHYAQVHSGGALKDAIGLDSTVDSIVRGNRILKIGTPAWAGAGVRCEGQSAVVLATAVQIAGNTVTDYTTVGVKFENAEGCTARDNRVGFGGGANAIELGADAYSCAVEDNTIVDTTAGTYNGIRVWGDKNFISGNTTNIGGTGAGIELVTGASFNIVTGNQTMNNGITDGGTSTTLANNRDDA